MVSTNAVPETSGWRAEDVLDLVGDDPEAVVEFLVAAIRERHQAVHHLVNIYGQRRQLATDKGHTERFARLEHVLGDRHEFERIVIGRKQRAEVAVVLAEGGLDCLGSELRPWTEQAGEESEHVLRISD